MAIINILIYYFRHISTSEFVFEDTQWLQILIFNWKFIIKTVPNNYFAIWTFYVYSNDAIIQHSVNLFIHILNALVLALLIENWDGPGWIIGSLFLINPLAIQAVAYAAGRSELLSLTALLSFLWFISVDDSDLSKRWIGLAFSVAIMLTTKPTVILIAPFLFIWLYISNYDIRLLKGIKWLSLGIPIIIFLCLHILSIRSQIPVKYWIMAQTSASWNLMYSALTGRNLSIDHAWWAINFDLQVAWIIAGIITIIVIALNNKHRIAFGLGWWWISLAPRLFISSTLGWIREQHAYVPLVGFCIALGSLIGESDGTQRIY